jgi:Uma2 family endonuclease
MPTPTDVPFFTLSPDWVCEVVSPSTGRIDRSRKMRIYGDAGVTSLWLVDPLAKTLEVYRREADRLDRRRGPRRRRPRPGRAINAVELALTRWWLPDAAG